MPDVLEGLQGALAGRYRFEREVGRGGMATVYLAQDLKHRRPVAVKVLHPHLAANVGADRFLREIEIAAGLNHPHILTLIDSGSADNLLYYVMPFVEGESLRGRLAREGRLPVGEAVELTRRVAGALAYAHARGVVHRDVKPENVMLHEGEPMVTDFGIAKALSGGTESLTQTGTSLGTPAYMSPEQASGEHEIDGRSDIYSLGCMLHEMLAGEPPFAGPTAQAIIVRRFTEPARPVRALRPEVPEQVERALLRALARDPGERFPAAAQFAQALAPAAEVRTPPDGGPTVVTASHRAVRSIAVLPFADMSAAKDQDYFCEGIAEEIINALAKVDALQVASRSSAFAFKGKNQDIRQVGEQLNVATVMEGSVRKAGNRLRITAQLINVTDGYHLWSERYDRELEDVFAVQDEIAENIVRALRVVLTDEQRRAIERPHTENVEAYEFYLRGRQFFYQFREKGLQFARRMFARAIEIDPEYARAYAGIADCSSQLYKYWDASAANLEQAESASRKALELAPDLAEAHAARGFALTLGGNHEEANREFEAAIRLDPKLYEGYLYYANGRFAEGKLAEAAKLFEQASAVRTEDYQAPGLAGLCYAGLGREAEGRAAFERSVRAAERHIELNPDDPRAYYLGAIAWCRLGQVEKGLGWGDRALALDPGDAGVLYNVACLNGVAGRAETALDHLERAVQNGFGHREWIEHDPDLESLRSDPRYQALLSRL
jgi:TolB-like protein/Flp pilus assembly protein TadD/tRNA A-37 threonylcarbamoyl transferase component Bud32